MSNKLYPKLAISNLKKNKNAFVPFGLSCGMMIAMFYMLASITGQVTDKMFYGARTMKTVLEIGVRICGIFSVAVIFYTNNFLMKKRTRELGLYSILGMEKKHIRKVLFWEICFVGGLSLLCGLAAGILFSKLMFLVLLNILNLETSFRFVVSFIAITETAVLFMGIFLIIILYNQISLLRLKPVNLLNEAKAGEKEPKANWILAAVGFVCLGIGYYIALSAKNPIKAMDSFFLAVLLVILGTYSLFISGSIAILKLLKKQKSFYYHKKHFITVSFMTYRMKQNAAGLANICILSTAVLVVLSSTVSLYLGLENVMRTRYPKDVRTGALYMPNEDDGEENSYDMSLFEKTIDQQCTKYGVEKKNAEGYYSLSLIIGLDHGRLFSVDNQDLNSMRIMEGWVLEDFNRIMNEDYTLKQGEALWFDNFSNKEEQMNTIKIGSFSAKIVNEDKSNIDFEKYSSEQDFGIDGIFLVVPDRETLSELSDAYTEFTYEDYDKEEGTIYPVQYIYDFDLKGDLEQKIPFCNSLREALNDAGIAHVAITEDIFTTRQEILGIYGSLFFVGIFMGILFLLTTALIIYYKQISEGYEDRSLFIILQKVGMSKGEVKKVIHSQILSIFFLPILLAVIHVAFAFPILKRILYMLNLTNVSLFIGCTIGTIFIFFLIYAIVYGVTAKVYYRLVNE